MSEEAAPASSVESAPVDAAEVGATGVRRPSRTRRLRSCVWWTTSKEPPSSGYSPAIVLKQCAQETTILRGLASVRVSIAWAASIWKSASLPARRAGSPVQDSPEPRTAKDTPAVCSSSATAALVFFAVSS